ncbi:unnamed protein product [Clonostachys rosea f. rosea IK726]|uniref:Uncharacterized protein n=1 Tax=Clonostachys rosea f. rosea IK726 TaxID=1349383 RepID=A0ACA9TTJ3_BIOOC|nr:unnamed protein product [Clonostachys rosea f. rosea IK726]
MPLHLLGKKSWNVYNEKNIARVRRDEAAAQAAEEAEEQRMQEVDAARRLAILRGEEPPPLEDEQPKEVELTHSRDPSSFADRPKKKRKRAGEDDTEFELRLAHERNEAQYGNLEVSKKPSSSAPIMDRSGHIDLFGDERASAHGEKNEEAEKEAKKKKREVENQYTMRFSNAAGRDALAQSPWYSKSDMSAPSQPTKDVWGNDDPKRKGRDDRRLAANDPLAAMRSGASKVRELKAERKKLQAEREEELRQLRREQRHNERRERRDDRSPRPQSSRDHRRRRDRSSERKEDGERHSDRRRGSRRDRSPERRRRHRSHSPEHSRSRHRYVKEPT